MSDDEIFITLVSGTLALLRWAAWYYVPARVGRMGTRATGRATLAFAPLLGAAVLFLVLRTAASFDVRDDARYLVLYMILGAGWVGLATLLFPLLGVSARDDVVERGNRAAAYAISGAIVAVTLCYAGGNIGDGPGWWVVLFSAALATAALFALWLALDGIAHVADAVTVERDRASGVRLAGFLVACGLVLGRAVAGDWVSAVATVNDFLVLGSPALVLLGVAALIERRARPAVSRPEPSVASYGVLPAAGYVAAALAYVASLGPAA